MTLEPQPLVLVDGALSGNQVSAQVATLQRGEQGGTDPRWPGEDGGAQGEGPPFNGMETEAQPHAQDHAALMAATRWERPAATWIPGSRPRGKALSS